MLPLSTLNSVKERGSNGALRSHLFAKGRTRRGGSRRFLIYGHVGNGIRFGAIRDFKKSWPVRRAFGRELIASLSGRNFERRALHLCRAASVESVRRAGSKQRVSNRAGALIFGGVSVAGNKDVNRVWHVGLHYFTPLRRRRRVGRA